MIIRSVYSDAQRSISGYADTTDDQRQMALSYLEANQTRLREDVLELVNRYDSNAMMKRLLLNSYGPYFETLEIQKMTNFYRSALRKRFLRVMQPLATTQQQSGKQNFSKYFSDQEQQEIAHFFQSPLAKKMQSVQPKMVSELKAMFYRDTVLDTQRIANKYISLAFAKTSIGK